MNLETINKWLDNEYGVSYTRLEELHDFVVEQDLKHQEKAQKEIDRLNNDIKTLLKENEAKEKVIKKQDYVINELEKYIRNYINLMVNNPDIIEQGQLDILYEVLDKLKELKENRDEK